MLGKIVPVNEKKFRLNPNLEDYEKEYKGFNEKKFLENVEFFDDGKINAVHNAIDKHLKTRNKDKVALYWKGGEDKKQFTFGDISDLSNKVANMLVSLGIKKQDRVFIFLPRIPELYISFLGILKTGAIAGTLFEAFGPGALKDRLADSGAKIVITTKELKERVDAIIGELPALEKIIVVDADFEDDKQMSYKKRMLKASDKFDVEHMELDDYAFMLYTSGTTGRPKGVVHCHRACLYEQMTARWVLDLHEEDIFWCTADPGWVTGIAYGIIGPWSNGITQVVVYGRFDPDEWYRSIAEYKVNVLYTAPTAVRMLMKKASEADPGKHDLSSLRYICSVGEPLNPEAIDWGMKKFGLPIHDNYWQTETGGIVIANYPMIPMKMGYMGRPVPGIVADVVDDAGKVLPANTQGNLVLKPGWPSMMRCIWKNETKYKEYFKNDWYWTGDKAIKDKDGYFLFVGRSDDVIKTAGHRVGPFEVESALIEHPAIAEAGVIGIPDEILGEKIKAFIVLNPGYKSSDELDQDIRQFIKKSLAGHAYPKEIQVVDSLPKTRSGKIMRRVLKAKELGEDVGDTSTLTED